MPFPDIFPSVKIVRNARKDDLSVIHHILKTCELDSREVKASFFLLAELPSGEIVGCIRHKIHSGNVAEICSWGVLPSFRNRGYGRLLLQAKLRELKEKGYASVYVITVEEKYFLGSGFVRDYQPPSAIQEKIRWCTRHLPYPLPYFAMRHENQNEL